MESIDGCRTLRELLAGLGREGNMIVHHWDSDGASSAALVLRYTGPDRWEKIDIPRIGFYSAKALPEPLPGLNLILDYGIDGSELDLYARGYNAIVAAVDHHRVSPPLSLKAYCNPVSAGLGGEEEYPSCSFLLGKLLYSELGNIERELVALGIVGDLAPIIDSGRRHRAVSYVVELLEGTSVSLQVVREAVDLVDANYRVLDKECLRKSVLALAREGVRGVFGLTCAKRNLDKAVRMIDSAFSLLEKVFENDKVEVYRLSLNAYLTSAIGRRLASRKPWKVVVLIHTIPSTNTTIFYIRSIERDLSPLRRALVERGVRVAGKTHVLVLETMPSGERRLLQILLDAFTRSGLA